MSDLFHDQVPDEFIARVFAVMFCTPRHTFQVLTKRHARLRSLLNSHEFVLQVDRALYNDHGRTEPREALSVWPLPNVWLGVSVENQQWADIRIPALLETPAAVRFLSCEPLLGPVDLSAWLPVPLCDECDANMEAPMCNGCHRAFEQRIGWCIVGGESGPGARPMHPQWARDIRDQCNSAGVPFLFKQWGEWAPTGAFGVGIGEVSRRMFVSGKSHPVNAWMDEEIARVGKKAAGRELDGRTWDEYPA
jgi:protein gp37